MALYVRAVSYSFNSLLVNINLPFIVRKGIHPSWWRAEWASQLSVGPTRHRVSCKSNPGRVGFFPALTPFLFQVICP